MRKFKIVFIKKKIWTPRFRVPFWNYQNSWNVGPSEFRIRLKWRNDSFRVLIKLYFKHIKLLHFFLRITSFTYVFVPKSQQIIASARRFHSSILIILFFLLFQASGKLVALRKENGSHSRSNRTIRFLRCGGYALEFRKNCRRRSQNIEVILSFLFPQFRINNVLRIVNV